MCHFNCTCFLSQLSLCYMINVTRFCSKCYGLHYETVIWDEFYNKTRWSWQDDGLTLPTHPWSNQNIRGTQSEDHHTISNSWNWEIGNVIFSNTRDISHFIQILSFVSFCVLWSFTDVQSLWIIYRYINLTEKLVLLDEIFHHSCFSLTQWWRREGGKDLQCLI